MNFTDQSYMPKPSHRFGLKVERLTKQSIYVSLRLEE